MSIDNQIYAIIETGGKQFKVYEGMVFHIEKTDKKPGENILARTLLISDDKDLILLDASKITTQVELEIIANERDDKVLIFKKKRRKNSQSLNGHRQWLDLVKVKKINY